MKRSAAMVIGMTFGVLMVAGCGGGGGGGSSATPVTVKFRTYSSSITNFGIYSGIRSVGFRLDLPVGVTVATDPLDTNANKRTADGVIKLSGVLTTTFKNLTSLVTPRPFYGVYSSAKPAGSGKGVVWVNLTFSSSTPVAFDKGEFLTLNCIAVSGAATAPSAFVLSEKLIYGNLINLNTNDLTSKYKLGLF